MWRKLMIFCFLTTGLLFLAEGLTGQKRGMGADWSEDYLKAHVAITAVQPRDLSDGNYVCEIHVRDYGNSKLKPEGFGMKGYAFADNGRGYDLVAGDGIYTSTTTFPHKIERAKGVPEDLVYTDPAFQHEDQLSQGREASKIKIKCKFVKCGCPCPGGGSCPACDWFSWSCWEIKECDIEFELL